MIYKNKALKLYDDWAEDYLDETNITIDMKYTRNVNIGNGFIRLNKDVCNIFLGIGGSSFESDVENNIVTDADFIKLGATLFHEFAHYEQHTSKNIPEIITSSISTIGNKDYYQNNWNKFLHEINAEYNGIMNMWDRLDEFYSSPIDKFTHKADRLMFKHLHSKIYDKDGNKLIYMIEEPEGGFKSRKQVEELFETAYENAPKQPKSLLLPGLAQNEDENEIVRLMTVEGSEGRIIQPEYVSLHNKIVTAKNGYESDKFMASIALHLHPGIKDSFPDFNSDDLSAESIFGIPFPETTEEIRNRIGDNISNDDSFEHAVEMLDDLISQENQFINLLI